VSAKARAAAQKQSITFEPDGLPGEVFRITIPEIVSDGGGVIVPWSQPSPNWDIDERSAGWSAEAPGRFSMTASVTFTDGPIATTVALTNLSPNTWTRVTAFTCLAYWESPLFDDPDLSRTYVPVENGWKAVGELFRDHDPGGRPYTFFPVEGRPPLASLWLCREIPQWHPDGSPVAPRVVRATALVAGECQGAAFVFVNRRERCVHANAVVEQVVRQRPQGAEHDLHHAGTDRTAATAQPTRRPSLQPPFFRFSFATHATSGPWTTAIVPSASFIRGATTATLQQ
jgi:hypothetical protein